MVLLINYMEGILFKDLHTCVYVVSSYSGYYGNAVVNSILETTHGCCYGVQYK